MAVACAGIMVGERVKHDQSTSWLRRERKRKGSTLPTLLEVMSPVTPRSHTRTLPGEKRDRVGSIYCKMGQNHQKADQETLHKGNTMYLIAQREHNVSVRALEMEYTMALGTDNSGFFRDGRSQVPRTRNLNSFEALALALDWPSKPAPG